jgi:HEAT repeat protein
MKIHFCDLCNESVPQADLDEGRAFIRKGRIVCAACDRAMSQPNALAMPESSAASPQPGGSEFGGGPAGAFAGAFPGEFASASAPSPHDTHRAVSIAALEPPTAQDRTVAVRNSSAGLWMAALAMAFTAGAIFVQNRRLEDAARANRETRDEALRMQQKTAVDLQRLERELASSVRGAEERLAVALEANRKAMSRDLEQWRADDGKQKSELQAEVKGLSTWRGDVGAQSQADKRVIDELTVRLAKSEDAATKLADRLQTMEQAAKAPPPAAAAPAAKNEPGWKALLVDLTSANAGVRWEAVDGLGQARDPQVIPALLPMLKDPDVFVRMATARVLGDLKAQSAMSGLLDALEDSEDAVREAAFVAMRSIVGNKELKFDPLAPEAERAKRLKALREWWKKEEESGTGRG